MKRYWYKFRVKYGKELGTGNKKKVSEEYLVDAGSFTETEKRANKAATELIGTRDFDITAISREPITEILRDDEDDASDINNAANILTDRMADSNTDWEIKSIAETKVLAVLNYKA